MSDHVLRNRLVSSVLQQNDAARQTKLVTFLRRKERNWFLNDKLINACFADENYNGRKQQKIFCSCRGQW